MDPPQIQTPPPTRDASSRRRTQQLQSAAFGTPSTIVSRHASTFQTPQAKHETNPIYQPSPVQFSTTQFEPGVFQYSSSGATTAPAYSQPHLLWNQNSDASAMDVDEFDPFGPGPQRDRGIFGWQNLAIPINAVPDQSFQTSSSHSMPVSTLETTRCDTSRVDTQESQGYSQPTSFHSATTGVDPSLLFSFSNPTELTDVSRTTPQLSQFGPEQAVRQPYEHQTKQSMREKEFQQQRIVQSCHARTNTGSSTASFSSVSTARPGLQRSNTVGHVITNNSINPFQPAVSLQRSNTAVHIPRKPSPLKRPSLSSLAAISETFKPRPRPSVVLTIDESGRARTETIIVEDDAEARVKLQYPGLWDDGDSDDSSDSNMPVLSRTASLALPESERCAKAARIETSSDGIARPTIARSASSASLRNSLGTIRIASPGLRRSSSARRPTTLGQKNRKNTLWSFDGSLPGTEDNKNETEMVLRQDDEADDAHSALRRVVEDRSKRQELNDPQTRLSAHNKRWAKASAKQFTPKFVPNQQYACDMFGNLQNTPSTAMAASNHSTPMTDAGSSFGNTTRCVCDSLDGDGQLMIQCESCSSWLHVRCAGLNSQMLPPVYVCVFCTGQTPNVRGGRVREPARATPAYSSPLAHKTTHYQ
ncbi:hypothetical protein LTR16_000105 [Cryomyces antarcticus]|uniref:Zinc finger PHD-type domain-containing protein n=1 Tax=Cryomyces antarcticus TaxID=329879 RepID=A0ABR0KUV8_9PEZI|nr:hypothetical protein LTR16_000105 [Cryomyces antarcticus]